jgi:predicted nucleic acid-binding protein
MIGIDTNLLVYGHRAGTPEHRAAVRALETASRDPRGWGVALPSIAEFWSIVTHPACVGGPSVAGDAHGFLAGLVEGGAVIWTPGDDFWRRLTRLAAELGTRGARIFDLQIALAARDNGATEIWTHDAGFVSIEGLHIKDPLR